MTQPAVKMILLLTCVFAWVTAFGQTVEKATSLNKSSSKFNIDTSRIAILPFDASIMNFFDGSTADGLTQSELLEIEELIVESISDYNSKLTDKEKKYYSINLNKRVYRRQYVCAINRSGEKEVFINFFCMTLTADWKQSLVFVHDGGTCFFNFKLNLVKKNHYDFFVNGRA